MNDKDTEGIFQESERTAEHNRPFVSADLLNKATVPFRVDKLLQEYWKENVERDTFENTIISPIHLKEGTKLLSTLLKSLSKIRILLGNLSTANVLYFTCLCYATQHIFMLLAFWNMKRLFMY